MKKINEVKIERIKKSRAKKQSETEFTEQRIKLIEDTQLLIAEKLTELAEVEKIEPQDLEPKLDTLNEKYIELISLLSDGFVIKNLDGIKLEPKFNIPKELLQKNIIEFPEWMKNPPENSNSEIIEALQNNAEVLREIKQAPADQKPESFIPFRRVVKQGNKLVFDDSSSNGQISGGGTNIPLVNGSVPVVGGLTDTELRATPIPISATDLDIRNLVFATDKVDASGSTLGSNSGVDIGDVTINNGSGVSAVNIQDGGNSITIDDGGTSITVDGIPQLTVSNAIDQTAYALGTLAFSATSNIINDYILDHVEFNFSTTQSRTITITTFDGTKLWEDTNTSLNIVLEDIDKAFNASENFTISVTQTGGVCAMDVIAVVREGSLTLGGNPTVTVDGDVTAINSVHKRIHEGVYYSGGYYNASVADNASIMLLIQGSTPVTHLEYELTTSGDAIADFYEGTTFSVAGTAVTMSNHNRRSANTFGSTVTHTPTVTADGTAVNGTNLIPGGTKSSGTGSSQILFTGEFVLAASTNYLIRFTNKSGGAQKMNIELRAYEHAI